MAAAKQKFIIAGNWKMNPATQVEASKIFDAIKKQAGTLRNVQTLICVPNLYLETLKKKVTGHRCVIGAQDLFWEKKTGAFTGEVSAEQLMSSGAEYVIVGHSERRALGETDRTINQKVTAALKAGLKVVLCVGERERDNEGEYLRFIAKQLVVGLQKIPRRYYLNLIVAYEPIWAIGKSAERPATSKDVMEMGIFIRKVLAEVTGKDIAMTTPVLYGGSVNEKNAEEFLKEGEAQGLLVGRASLAPEKFNKILSIANDVKIN